MKKIAFVLSKNSSQIFDATKLWKHTIPLTYNTKTLISNISETHHFSPQMKLIAYSDHKTEFLVMTSKFHQQKDTYHTAIQVDSASIVASSFARNLGVMFDNLLSMEKQVKKISQSVFYQISNVNNIRKTFIS